MTARMQREMERPSHFGPHDSQVVQGVPPRTLCGIATFAIEDRSKARRLGIAHGKQPRISWSNGWEYTDCKRCIALRGLTQQEQLIASKPVTPL